MFVLNYENKYYDIQFGNPNYLNPPLEDIFLSNLKKQMSKVTINGKEYDTENINEEAKRQLVSLQFATAELQRLEAQLAITRTAQVAYSNAFENLADKD